MPPTEAGFEEAKRQLTICNACRYCEGYCAVFRALGRRSVLTDGDVGYIANLCHDCRGCYQACMFTPPHEFAMNVPLALSEARTTTSLAYAWPQRLSFFFERSTAVTGLAGLVGLLIMLGVALVAGQPDRLVRTDAGPGSFYRIVPWLSMVVPAMALGVWAFLVLVGAGVMFWRSVNARARVLPASVAGALADVLTLRWLAGDGEGCYYPDHERPSTSRRLLHSAVFYGFLLAFASTAVAALYQEILGVLPPYDYVSLPVILGSAGGMAMIVGTTGLLFLKARSPRDLAAQQMWRLDVAFLVALDLASITGMLLLALRETPLMPAMLLLHLASLAALYVTAPYGKFGHAVYRSLALLQDHLERAREARAGQVASAVAAVRSDP